MQIQIEGLDRLLKKTDPAFLLKPLRNFFERSTRTIEAHAKEKAPVDTGLLRSSIGSEIDASTPPRWGQVGTAVVYAPFMEYGTGLLAAQGARERHFPPGEALELWAGRHGIESGFQVAAAIGRRGGLKPHLFLTGAVKASLGAIEGYVRQLGSEIGQQWEARNGGD